MMSAILRLSIESSMKVAGRKMVVSISTPGKTRPHLVDRLFHAPRHVERVRPGKLLDDEHQARAVVDDGVARERLVVDDDVGHVAEQDRGAVGRRDRDLRERIRRDDRLNVLDRQPLVRRVDEPSGTDHRSAREEEEPRVQRL